MFVMNTKLIDICTVIVLISIYNINNAIIFLKYYIKEFTTSIRKFEIIDCNTNVGEKKIWVGKECTFLKKVLKRTKNLIL